MIPGIPISSEQISVEDVWAHYENIRDTVVRDFAAAKEELIGKRGLKDERLFGMSRKELDSYFEDILQEIDVQASLFILAATEATIRVDFLSRVYERKKDAVSRGFRQIYVSRCDHNKVKVRFEEDILDTWSEHSPETKSEISRLKGAMRYRHWLAHGRYWVPKVGQRYDPVGLIQLITSLFDKMALTNT